MSIKILHAADFHLDSPFESLSDEKAAVMRAQQRAMAERIASIARDEKADIVLLSGDLFDSDTAYYETGQVLRQVFSEMDARIFISPGNHDFFCSKSPYFFMDFPENVHIFTSPDIRCVELEDLNCRVWGAGFTAPSSSPLLTGFTAPDDGRIDVMVLHGDTAGGERYNAVSPADIAASGLDYLALGHIHAYSGIKKAGDTYYAYPGCPQGRGFDETGVKGVIVGTVDTGSCRLEFVPVGGRQYVETAVDLTGSADAVSAVLAACEGLNDGDILRVVLSGEYDGQVDGEAIASALGERFFSVTVKDRTVAARDLWSGMDDESLTGLFLTKLKAIYDEGGDRAAAVLAARYGIAALEGREGWRP